MMGHERVRELEDEIESAAAIAIQKVGNQHPCVENNRDRRFLNPFRLK